MKVPDPRQTAIPESKHPYFKVDMDASLPLGPIKIFLGQGF